MHKSSAQKAWGVKNITTTTTTGRQEKQQEKADQNDK